MSMVDTVFIIICVRDTVFKGPSRDALTRGTHNQSPGCFQGATT